jgi:hypothetical protein
VEKSALNQACGDKAKTGNMTNNGGLKTNYKRTIH